MLKELRIYLRLRPYIKRLKELCKMRLSVNVIVQILALICQAFNQISGLLSPGNREVAALIIGVIQAVVALMAHFKNPDGTPATIAYIAPKKSNGISLGLLALPLLLFLLPCTVSAQDSPDQFIGAGGSYNSHASPYFSFNGLHAKRIRGISDNTYSFTFLDLISSKEKPFTVTPSITPGIAQELFKFGELPIYGTTGLGVAVGQDQDKLITGSTVGWAWTAGFAASIAISKDHSWKILPNVRVIKSSLSDWQGIFGILIGWGK